MPADYAPNAGSCPHPMRVLSGLSGAIIGVLIVVFAGSPRAQRVPQFRTVVDLVHLDVSVLDRDRRPVRGLTAEDFVILDAVDAGRVNQGETDLAINIPIATLQPGAHLLTCEVGGVRESVRFTIR